MLNSTTHWMPLVSSCSDHIPQEFRDQVVPLSSFPIATRSRSSGASAPDMPCFTSTCDTRSREQLLGGSGTYSAHLRPLVQEGDVWIFRNRRLPELALFVAAAILHTWPLASPGSWGRVDNADTALNAWVIAWVGMALPRDPLHLFNANIFYPEPRTLAFSEVMLPQAVLAAPLTWAGFDPVLVYNLLVMAGFALSGWAMAWVVSRWTGDRAAGIIAGLAYAFNAHTLVRFAHLQAMHVQYLPLALMALDVLLKAPNARWALLLAAACVLQALTSNYLLVMTAIAMAAAAAVRRETWRPSQLVAFTLAGIVSAALLAPFLYPYWLAHTEQGLVRTFDDVATYSATWRDWLVTGGTLHHRLWSHRFGATSALFPGIAVTQLALAAIVSGRAWRDPRATGAGHRRGRPGTVVRREPAGLPAAVRALPILKGIRVASRVRLAHAVRAARARRLCLAALRARVARSRRRAGGGRQAAVTAEALRAPMSFTVYEGSPLIYDRVAALDNAVLVELPFAPRETIYDNGPSVLYSAWHLKPLLNGYSGFTPASYNTHVEVMRLFPSAGTVASLRLIGVTHVLLHKRRVPADLVSRSAESPDLTLVAEEPDQVLYALGDGGR
jgi:hypothetical protein